MDSELGKVSKFTLGTGSLSPDQLGPQFKCLAENEFFISPFQDLVQGDAGELGVFGLEMHLALGFDDRFRYLDVEAHIQLGHDARLVEMGYEIGEIEDFEADDFAAIFFAIANEEVILSHIHHGRTVGKDVQG